MRVALGVLLAALSAPPEALTLEDAIAIAQRQAAAVVRARADVLIIDAQRARAIGAILPRFDIALRAGGAGFDDRIVEAPLYLDCASSLAPDGCGSGYRPPLSGFDQYVAADVYRDQYVVDDLFLGNFSASLSARQLVYDGGRWWTEIARFDDLERVRRETLREVEGNIRLDVVQNFYGFERARQSLDRVERRKLLGEQQLESARSLGRDVASAERNLAEDRLALARAEFAASRSRRSLNLALARSADTEISIVLPAHVSTSSGAQPQLKIPDLPTLFDAAIRHRAALELRRANLDAVAKFVDVRRAEMFPLVAVTGRYTRASRRPDRVFTDPYNSGFFAGFDVTVQWNLYRGGIDETLIQEAELNLDKTRVDYEEVKRAVLSEVEDRLQNLHIQLQVYALALDSVRPANTAVAELRKSYAAGEGSILSLRDAELKLTQAQVAAINARLDVEIARALLRRAVGIDLIETEEAQ